ncbi:NADPH2:quinone reductase [Marivita hallyeonensis]|uniref:NADPH2:quinone reductase n=2 Tax=Marivita hallyeonensis TaxID=996342 RepID=A0A1M5XN08_9RHOB|nr:NADPH2:quinone reductase [Marivita hallyeonensis]
MKAAWFKKQGAARDVLMVGEQPKPSPSKGEVLIRVHVSAVNPSDTNRRAGRVGHSTSGLVIPHYDGAGVIEAVGEDVTDVWVGKRVWTNIGSTYPILGTAAQYAVLPEENVAVLPDAVSFEHGACLGVPAMTAWCCLFSDGSIKGNTVLVTGGAGAVGHYAVQLAKWAGARVVATVSSDSKAEFAREGGADHIINYRDQDVASRVMEITGGDGVDRVVDVDLGANVTALLGALKIGGVIATYASQAEHFPSIDAYGAMRKSMTLKFVLLPMEAAEQRREARAGITQWLQSTPAIHQIHQSFALEDIADAHEVVEAGQKRGCVLVALP